MSGLNPKVDFRADLSDKLKIVHLIDFVYRVTTLIWGLNALSEVSPKVEIPPD